MLGTLGTPRLSSVAAGLLDPPNRVAAHRWRKVRQLLGQMTALIAAADSGILGVVARVRRFHEGLVLQNAQNLGHFESLLRAGLYMLPSRFRESELQTESGTLSVDHVLLLFAYEFSAYATISLLSFYHDLIIIKYFQRNPQFSRILARKLPPLDRFG